MMKLNSIKDLEIIKTACVLEEQQKPVAVTVCSGTGCATCGSAKLADAFRKEIKKLGLHDKVALRQSGCHGFCEQGPVTVINPKQICYLKATPEDVPEILKKTIMEGGLVDRLLYVDPQTGQRMPTINDIPFYKHQQRELLDTISTIDPTAIRTYFAAGGYSSLSYTLTKMIPEQVIQRIKDAELRGRGGGGFPTGKKWESTANAPGEPKYVIANGDEGDPGAYMDRSILEGNPHGVLEGLIIAGYAIGASKGYFYIRQEYPLALNNVKLAIEEAAEHGLLGKNILGTGFDFSVSIHRGAGAFVSGESSALMSAIEGHVGEPRPKHIHTSVQGLWEKPSCLNNVETLANVPLIVDKGANWFKSIGTEGGRGTKVFSLVGKVNNTGLVEVPMGITLREIIFKIGGGIPNGRKFKAIQTGGPSGGVLPESMLDLPIDFDGLNRVGSMMGSGGLIVMDEDTCMVDTARYYTDFLAHESCGKCIPCREGLRRMLDILTDICNGRGREGDIELLEDLSEVLREASLCALGKSAANPVMSTIRYFRDEYEAHIQEKRCPSLMCNKLIRYSIDEEKCVGCGLCEKSCPTGAVSKIGDKLYAIDEFKCIQCNACFAACPEKFNAVQKTNARDITAEMAA